MKYQTNKKKLNQLSIYHFNILDLCQPNNKINGYQTLNEKKKIDIKSILLSSHTHKMAISMRKYLIGKKL